MGSVTRSSLLPGHEVSAYGRDEIGGDPGRIRARLDDGKYLMLDGAPNYAPRADAGSHEENPSPNPFVE